MGVLTCNRKGCENIMCDHLSQKYGYICNECLNELKNGNERNVAHFMGRYKNKVVDDYIAWCEFVEDIFK